MTTTNQVNIFNTYEYYRFIEELEKKFSCTTTKLERASCTTHVSHKLSNGQWKIPPTTRFVPFAPGLDTGNSVQECLEKWFDRIERDFKASEGPATEKRMIKREIEIFYVEDNERFKLTFKDVGRKCHECQHWESTAYRLDRCGKCKEAFYCNKECQKKDWPQHKRVCKENHSPVYPPEPKTDTNKF